MNDSDIALERILQQENLRAGTYTIIEKFGMDTNVTLWDRVSPRTQSYSM